MDKWYCYIFSVELEWKGILYKIWKSIRPLKRICEIVFDITNASEISWYAWQNNPYDKQYVNIISIFESSDYSSLEKWLHKYFKKYKADFKREYFNLDIEKIENIDFLSVWEWFKIKNVFKEYCNSYELYNFELYNSIDEIVKRRELLNKL